MKTLIVTWAAIIMIMFFPSQFAADEINHMKMTAFNNIVDKHVQTARSDGYFKPDNIDSMLSDVSTALHIDKSEISVSVTTTPVYRTDTFDNRQSIKYSVSVPIKKLIAMNIFWNISDSKNQMNYVVSGESPSELLP